jgi:hypothetical protein
MKRLYSVSFILIFVSLASLSSNAIAQFQSGLYTLKYKYSDVDGSTNLLCEQIQTKTLIAKVSVEQRPFVKTIDNSYFGDIYTIEVSGEGLAKVKLSGELNCPYPKRNRNCSVTAFSDSQQDLEIQIAAYLQHYSAAKNYRVRRLNNFEIYLLNSRAGNTDSEYTFCKKVFATRIK